MYDEEEKCHQYLTIYKKDYIKRNPKLLTKYNSEQEFKDPICEGFKNYLKIDQTDLELPFEDGDIYLEKVKNEREKIGKMYFEKPLDHVTIKGNELLKGKSVYQVEYCDIEEDIRGKLTATVHEKSSLPEGWVIPHTTQKYDYRDPVILSKHALEPPLIIKPINNLGQNEKINQILNVQTGDSEYNDTIGNLGNFIVTEQMHGKIVHEECSCLQHNFNKN